MELVFLKAKQRLAKEISNKGTTPYPLTKNFTSEHVEVSKTKKFDFMYNLTGIIGLAAFAFIVYAIVYLEIPEDNKEVWIHLIGICEGIVLSIFGYFYGSAARKD